VETYILIQFDSHLLIHYMSDFHRNLSSKIERNVFVRKILVLKSQDLKLEPTLSI